MGLWCIVEGGGSVLGRMIVVYVDGIVWWRCMLVREVSRERGEKGRVIERS